MASQEEVSDFGSPMESAKAERYRFETVEKSPVALAELFHRQIGERLASIEKAEKQLSDRQAKIFEQEQQTYEASRKLLAEARAEADRLIKASEDEIARRLKSSEEQVSSMRALALPPPPRPGTGEQVMGLIQAVGNNLVEKGFDYLKRSLELAPENAAAVNQAAAKFVSAAGDIASGGASEAESRPEPSLFDFPMKEFNESAEFLGENDPDYIKSLYQRFAFSSQEELTVRFMCEIMKRKRELSK